MENNGQLRYKEVLYVLRNKEQQPRMAQKYHNTRLTGHLSEAKIFELPIQ